MPQTSSTQEPAMTTIPITPTLSRRTVLAAAGLFGLGATASRSRATPAASQNTGIHPIGGVSVETLCAGDSALVPGKQLAMVRVTLHPGACVAAQPHAGPVAVYIDSGILDIDVLDGAILVRRSLADGMWAGHRNMVAGDATRIAAGDQLFHDGSAYTLQNAGEEQAVLLASILVDAGVVPRTWLDPA
jgi:quercetin dioxygenase-like cupin family protein